MDVEEEILIFGETAVWIECDLCGCAYGGPGMNKTVVAVGQANVCVDCPRESRSREGKKQLGNVC
jgi:hypothetical protein